MNLETLNDDQLKTLYESTHEEFEKQPTERLLKLRADIMEHRYQLFLKKLQSEQPFKREMVEADL